MLQRLAFAPLGPLLPRNRGDFIIDRNLANHVVALVGDIDVAIGIHCDAVDILEEDFTVFEIAGFVRGAGEEPELVGFVNGGLEEEEEIPCVVHEVLRAFGENSAECGIRPSARPEEAAVEASGGEVA